MLSCREAARLLTESLETRLPLRRRISLRFHLMMCFLCRRYERQMRRLDVVFRRYGAMSGDTDHPDGPTLSAGAKDRMRAALRGDS